MESFNPAYQESYNGPLSKELRARIQRFRDENGATLQEIGKELSFSGPFISTLLNPKNPARIRTKHIDKIVSRVELAEIDLGWRKPAPSVKVDSQQAKAMTLDDHVDAIEGMGYAVTLVRKPRHKT